MRWFPTILAAAAIWAVGAGLTAAQSCSMQVEDGDTDRTIGDDGQFVWFNRFTPESFPLELTEVWAVIGEVGTQIGDDVDIVIHKDTDGDGNPGTGAVHVATYRVKVKAVGDRNWNRFTINPPLVLAGPGDVLIGLINREGYEGFRDFPAALDQTTPQRRSWVASYTQGDVPDPPTYPSDEQWDRIDAFRFPGNWMIRGICAGQEPGCGDGAKLSAKCKKGGTKVVGKLKTATPGLPVTFTLDGADPIEKTTNGKGKATGKWTGLSRGGHDVAVCELEAGC